MGTRSSGALLSPRPTQLTPAPVELGDILDARQIRTRFFQDRVSIEWILDHVAPDRKWKMGRIAVWYEGDVKAWMPLFVQAQQALARQHRDQRARP